MKKQLIALFMLTNLLASASFAGSPEITPEQMTCTQAQAVLNQTQSAILKTKNIFGSPLKIAVVATQQCQIGWISRPVYMKTLDKKQCFLGYTTPCEVDSGYQGGGN